MCKITMLSYNKIRNFTTVKEYPMALSFYVGLQAVVITV